MKKLEQLYEGKAKKVFATDDPNAYIVEYKDDATAFNGLKKGTIHDKGIMNNRISNHLMKMLEEKGCIRPDTVKVINHFSHNGGMTHGELEEFAREHGMAAAYDGMKVQM